jgi:hypothetical protein
MGLIYEQTPHKIYKGIKIYSIDIIYVNIL